MYDSGDFVVKANTGVCKIEGIEKKCLSNAIGEKDYYILVPVEDQRSRLYVPVDSEKANIRSAMSSEDAWALIHRIPDIESRWIESDRKRELEYKEAMRSNEPEYLVSIIKNLYLRLKEREMQGKKTTAVDDRYFKMAESALYGELAHAIGRDKSEMREIILETIEGRS